jgi:hypothetical protein
MIAGLRGQVRKPVLRRPNREGASLLAARGWFSLVSANRKTAVPMIAMTHAPPPL